MTARPIGQLTLASCVKLPTLATSILPDVAAGALSTLMMLGYAISYGVLFTSRLQSIVGPFAMRLGPEAFLFAMITGRKVSLFASPRHSVRKPLQLQIGLYPTWCAEPGTGADAQ
jgi:hypothetical protein